MRTRTVTSLSLLNIGLCFGLVGYGVLTLSDETDLDSRPIQDWDPTKSWESEALTVDNRQIVFSEAVTRPVFQKSRRPFVLPAPPQEQIPQASIAAEPPQPPPDSSMLVLRGVLVSGPQQRVLISSPEHPDGTWLNIGETAAGWTVLAITRNGATLVFGSHRVTLQLYVDKTANEVGFLP
jgi:hypothetical protein